MDIRLMRKVTPVFMLLAISGCAITVDQIEAAQKYCAPHGGLLYLPGQYNRGYKTVAVVCSDGSSARIKVRWGNERS